MMKNKLFVLLLALSLLLSFTCFADKVFLDDSADVLSPEEEVLLKNRLLEINKEYNIDLVVVTVNTLHVYDEVSYADDYYDYNGYGEDGALLLYIEDYGIRYLSTSGLCMDALDDSLSTISEAISPYFDSGDYLGAFLAFANTSADLVDSYNTAGIILAVVISLVVALVITFFVMGALKSQLHTVNMQHAAHGYVKNDSLKLTASNDLFLYRTVSRSRREEDSDSGRHVSSSGRTHGGGRV